MTKKTLFFKLILISVSPDNSSIKVETRERKLIPFFFFILDVVTQCFVHLTVQRLMILDWYGLVNIFWYLFTGINLLNVNNRNTICKIS